jgi:hypothetical protein
VNFRDGQNQSVSPIKSPGLQAGPSGGFIASVPANDQVYWIRQGDNGYTCVHFFFYNRPTLNLIHSPTYSLNSGNNGPDNWATSLAINGAKVAWGVNQGGKKEWILQPA